ncbi:MAG: chemotaxis protein CheD [Sulfurospirillaceae bacterium]|jgi:chemotaxis protein CheD|nr:chemotaxis protein CheD [Sulfurospirillaceae bacterium]MCK9545715.1 chemotaxis protein CheD [Sulfurospirillaceae bacterium]MDY0237794.1 chemotaxis protein CheD [Campylobacterales bacterium]NLM99595.1 chemotaxis protein CheD [Campylobacteraceae bacterium]
MQKKFIHVGEIFIGVRPTQISTILGSCIAVCLYDEVEKIGGMNHYLLPLWNENGLQSPKYGNISIPRLIEGMENVGCSRKNIVAKIFGGGNVIDVSQEDMMIGRKNILIAKEILREHGIKIVAQDVGGTKGRRIMMQSDNGKILLKYTSGN